MTIRIRRGIEADVATIADFNCRLAMETESRRLDSATVTRGVRRGMDAGNEVQYWIAEFVDSAGVQVIGQLMLTREWSDWRDGWLIWIQSVYVHPEHRGQGVFTTLFRHVSDVVRRDPDNIGIRLYVEHENKAAQTVYGKLGLVDPGYNVLEQMFR